MPIHFRMTTRRDTSPLGLVATHRKASPLQRSQASGGHDGSTFAFRTAWIASMVALFTGAPLFAQGTTDLKYPETRMVDQVDDYHGTKVADPFRWLEDDNSEETKGWVAAQNKLTYQVLEGMGQRAKFRERLTELWNYERFGMPVKRGGRYFYVYNDGLQNQSTLMVADSLDAEPRVLLDPNELSEDGTVTLASWSANEDGTLVAYLLGEDGSDWRRAHVLDVATGQRMNDAVDWIKFSDVSWAPDSEGFFYSRYDEPEADAELTGSNYFQKLYYHKVGTPQDQDQLFYERVDQKDWGFSGEVSEDGDYLVITVWKGTLSQNQIFYQSLKTPKDRLDGEVIELLTGFTSENLFIGNVGSKFLFTTDYDAPMRRVVSIDLENPAPENWEELVGEASEVIQGVSFVGQRLFVSYLKDANSLVKVYDLGGNHIEDVEFPGLGSVSGFDGESDDDETFYAFQNYTTPPSIYRYDLETAKSEVFRRPKLTFDDEMFESEQVFYRSKDGTSVPMIITYRKGIKRTGDNPTILYGYGGFDISITPRFSVPTLAWIEAGGIYAVANLRGGGEYGREWHEAGMLDNKQNVFDDFIAAAEYLIEEKFTSPEHLSISGRSNGGLLVGAAMCQRPELFAAALPGVGVMDMLRFHRFTIGHAWTSEYGSADEEDQFETLFNYSPLHNLKEGVTYPATLVLTADHDDRVVPAHSFKFAAELQRCQAKDGPPCLIRIETSGGHGAGKPVAMQIEEAADSLGFLASRLGLEMND